MSSSLEVERPNKPTLIITTRTLQLEGEGLTANQPYLFSKAKAEIFPLQIQGILLQGSYFQLQPHVARISQALTPSSNCSSKEGQSSLSVHVWVWDLDHLPVRPPDISRVLTGWFFSLHHHLVHADGPTQDTVFLMSCKWV